MQIRGYSLGTGFARFAAWYSPFMNSQVKTVAVAPDDDQQRHETVPTACSCCQATAQKSKGGTGRKTTHIDQADQRGRVRATKLDRKNAHRNVVRRRRQYSEQQDQSHGNTTVPNQRDAKLREQLQAHNAQRGQGKRGAQYGAQLSLREAVVADDGSNQAYQ